MKKKSFFTENQLFTCTFSDLPKNSPNYLLQILTIVTDIWLFFLKQITCMEIRYKEYLKEEKCFLLSINIFWHKTVL